MVGGIFQKEGAEKTLEELSVMLFNIATMGCRFRGYENLVDELLAYADKKVSAGEALNQRLPSLSSKYIRANPN